MLRPNEPNGDTRGRSLRVAGLLNRTELRSFDALEDFVFHIVEDVIQSARERVPEYVVAARRQSHGVAPRDVHGVSEAPFVQPHEKPPFCQAI